MAFLGLIPARAAAMLRLLVVASKEIKGTGKKKKKKQKHKK